MTITNNVNNTRHTNNTLHNFVTLQMIADRTGYSIATVCRAVKGKYKKTTPAIMEVKKVIDEVGYMDISKRKEVRAERNKEKYLETHNFPSEEAETRRMECLRERGYSNEEIAQKVGKCTITVRRRIGPQDPMMSTMNRVYGVARRKQRELERESYVATRIISESLVIVKQVDELKAEIKRCEQAMEPLLQKLKEMEPNVSKAKITLSRVSESMAA